MSSSSATISSVQPAWSETRYLNANKGQLAAVASRLHLIVPEGATKLILCNLLKAAGVPPPLSRAAVPAWVINAVAINSEPSAESAAISSESADNSDGRSRSREVRKASRIGQDQSFAQQLQDQEIDDESDSEEETNPGNNPTPPTSSPTEVAQNIAAIATLQYQLSQESKRREEDANAIQQLRDQVKQLLDFQQKQIITTVTSVTPAMATSPPVQLIWICPNNSCSIVQPIGGKFCSAHGALVTSQITIAPPVATTYGTGMYNSTNSNTSAEIIAAPSFSFTQVRNGLLESTIKDAAMGKYIELSRFKFDTKKASTWQSRSAIERFAAEQPATFQILTLMQQSKEMESSSSNSSITTSSSIQSGHEFSQAFLAGLVPIACANNPKRYADYLLFYQQLAALMLEHPWATVFKYCEMVRLRLQSTQEQWSSHTLAAYNSSGVHENIWSQLSVKLMSQQSMAPNNGNGSTNNLKRSNSEVCFNFLSNNCTNTNCSRLHPTMPEGFKLQKIQPQKDQSVPADTARSNTNFKRSKYSSSKSDQQPRTKPSNNASASAEQTAPVSDVNTQQ